MEKKMKIIGPLKEIIAENLGVSLHKLQSQSRISDLENDSLDKLETLMHIEDKFGTFFSGQELDNFFSVMTIKEIAALIRKKIDAKSKNPKSPKETKISKKG